MDNPNRINPTAITSTLSRQTPKNDFGQVLSKTLSGAIAAGGALASAVPGVPALSAAVASVQAFAHSGQSATGAASSQSYAASGIQGLGSAPAAPYNSLSTAAGAPSSGGEFSDPSVREMASMSQYYLKVQNEMQAESRAFNSVTNILKVRHDSAKAAINNIR